MSGLISLLIVLANLYLVVVRPAEAQTRECPHCFSSIPLRATGCAFCTRDVPQEVFIGGDITDGDDDEAP